MKKEAIVWQIIVFALGLFMIFTINIYLKNKIIIDAMKIQGDIMTRRADCFMSAEEKNLNNSYCNNVDTTAYRLFEKYQPIVP